MQMAGLVQSLDKIRIVLRRDVVVPGFVHWPGYDRRPVVVFCLVTTSAASENRSSRGVVVILADANGMLYRSRDGFALGSHGGVIPQKTQTV